MNKPEFLLVDRDGVLNVNRPDYLRTPAQLELAPGVLHAMALLKEASIRVLVITNQACIGKGLVSPATLEEIHALLQERITVAGGKIDRFYHCPHTSEAACTCRKPLPGLIHQAQQEWGFDPSRTWMVGDAERDIRAAQAAGCPAALVRGDWGIDLLKKLPGIAVFDNLVAFVHAYLHPADPARLGRIPPSIFS